MFFRLLLLFTLVPIIELYILIKIGTIIGPLPTLGIVIATALLGAYLVKIQGVLVLYRMREEVRHGRFPGNPLVDGFLILIAGALLITPGVLTDITGFLILWPATRRHTKKWLKKKLLKYLRGRT